MLIIDHLLTLNLTNSEKIAREYILKNHSRIHNMTLSEVAHESFTSESTFIRLAKKLGLSGWVELRAKLTKECHILKLEGQTINANMPFDETNSFEETIKQVSQLKISTITDTVELMNTPNFETIIKKIYQSSEILIFANSINIQLLEDFAFKMRRLGTTTRVSNIHAEQLHDAQNIRKEGIAIFVSYSGYFDRLNHVIDILKNKNIPILAITNIGGNYLSSRADYHLYISTRESLYAKVANFSTSTSIMHIMDLIYSCIYSLNYEKNMEHVIYTEKHFSNRKLDTHIVDNGLIS